MNGRFTKTAISPKSMIRHTHLIHPLKAIKREEFVDIFLLHFLHLMKQKCNFVLTTEILPTHVG